MQTKIIKRYSTALYKSALEAHNEDVLADEVSSLLNLIKGSRDLFLFFESPVISRDKKLKTVEAIFSGKVSPVLLNFIKMLIENKRETLINEILLYFIDYKNEKDGIIRITINTVVELNDDEKKTILDKIQEQTGFKCIPEFKTDPDLIGGFTVFYKDEVIDASVKNQLLNLKKLFKKSVLFQN